MKVILVQDVIGLGEVMNFPGVAANEPTMLGEIAATMAEEMAEIMLAPVRRIGAPSTPAPFVPVMEDFYKPSVEKIIGVVRESVAY